MDRTVLESCGIGFEKGVARCLGDEQFYQSLLEMFLRDDAFTRAEAAYAARDWQALFACCHEIKGTSGNAELTALYDAVCPLVELLRGGSCADAEVEAPFTRFAETYRTTMDGIRRAIGQTPAPAQQNNP